MPRLLSTLTWLIGALLAAQTVAAQPMPQSPDSAPSRAGTLSLQANTYLPTLSLVTSSRAILSLTTSSFATPLRGVSPRQASVAAYGPETRRFLGQEHPSTHSASPSVSNENSPVSNDSPPADVASLAQARQDAERAHLWRVAVWGTLNAAGGLALVLGTGRTEQPAYWGFGAQSGLWGAVNIGIAAAGLAAGGDVSTGYDAALSAERTYHDILLFNLGLNVAYSAVGTTLVLVSYRGVDSIRSLRGHGSSLIMQGAGLIVLDTIAFLGSRTRLAGLLDMAGSISARALPTGFAVSISL